MPYSFVAAKVAAYRPMKISGKKLRELRESLLLTREELAAKTTITLSALQRIEQATVAGVSMKTTRKLCEGLEVPVDELKRLIGAGEMAEAYTELLLPRHIFEVFQEIAAVENKSVPEYLDSVAVRYMQAKLAEPPKPWDVFKGSELEKHPRAAASASPAARKKMDRKNKPG